MKEGICVRISPEAAEEYRLFFGKLKRTEIERELSFYVKKNSGVKDQVVLKLNYDNEVLVSLKRMKGGWDVDGFERIQEKGGVVV
jgi:hypothetical protein